ncbi:hypothetical protein [Hydrogenoanaerobacterium sp.]|uniref:hypothetical protein n=1 Tax=Hydrogenoanaerobacterium sp. TaxID=2953763 RepID=UPI00289E2CDF|nr:hypothetical protein [Hydrogenoanaerobacterium sp.]
MKRITVSLSLLKEKLLEIENDNMDLVELRIVSGTVDNMVVNAPFLHFEGISKNGAYKDYESIDESSIVGMFA